MNTKLDARPIVRRREAAGHMNAAYARGLLALSGRSDGDDRGRAFLERARAEELSQELGRAFLESATSGEEAGFARHERVADFEDGGPFVVMSAPLEFAQGPDEATPAGATTAPFSRGAGGHDAR